MFVRPPADLLAYHEDFYRQHNLSGETKGEGALDRIKLRTSRAFGFEWTEFSHYDADNYEKMLGPGVEVDLNGRSLLEIGCGAGRHAKRSALRGARVFAVDYSLAVESAARRCANLDNIFIVQADVFALPFKRFFFDCGYSLGVLHHLPKPEVGFGQLVDHVKPGGEVMIWVYKKTLRKILFEPVRKHLSRLPLRILKTTSFIAAIVDYGFFCNLYRFCAAFSCLHPIAKITPNRIKEYSTYDFQVSYTDWFDRLSAPIVTFYTEPEIATWYRNAGISQFSTSSQADFGVRGLGRKDP